VFIILALLVFYQILLDEDHLPYRFAHFWIALCIIVYWGATFTGWGAFAAVQIKMGAFGTLFGNVVRSINYLFYLGLAAIFYQYKKLIPSGYHAR
jgi:hypothetical protein